MKDYKILIDGYNLRLPKGSGIKYYTISLIKALEKKNIDISLLFDYNLETKEIIEIEFIEKYYRGEVNVNKKNLIRNLWNLSPKIFDIVTSIKDKENDFLKRKKIINITNVFLFQEIASKFDFSLNLNLDNIDIFHSTYMLNISFKHSKRITTIHDLIPLKLPHTTLDNKKIFFNKVKKALEISDKIITISETSKKDILEFFDVPEDKVVNCYQSLTLSKELLEFDFSVKKFDLEKNEYFLFVGNIEPKKNIGRVIQAFLNINTDKKLVIVGKKAWLWEDLLKGSEKAIKKGKIILLDYVTREDLVALYQNAFGFVFPSLYEGFGLPPLEAMACKCPVITSNVSSLPEVCENAAIYCDPYSIVSIQNAMEKLLNMSESERKELISKGLKRVEFFNEEDYAKRIINVYESVL